VDNCGNSALDQIQTITVSDNTAPTFTRPANITIFTDANCNYNAGVGVTGDVTNETDNCSTGLNATFNDVTIAGPCEGSQVITRTWSLVDNCGECSFKPNPNYHGKEIILRHVYKGLLTTLSSRMLTVLQCSTVVTEMLPMKLIIAQPYSMPPSMMLTLLVHVKAVM
jgi:hypothetical protein